MADIKSPEERSHNMSKIRSRDTRPEEYVRKLLFRNGYRYRKNVSYIYGHPDAWLAKYNTAVFVNGCFWHRHTGCKYAYMPKSRIEFWSEKFRKNVERDHAVRKELEAQNIRILIIWECTIKQMMRDARLKDEKMDQIIEYLDSVETFLEL